MSADTGVWVGWELEDGEPVRFSSDQVFTGPRILVPSEQWAEYLRAKQLVRRLEGDWTPYAVEEQRDWDARHPPPPLSPEMQAIRDVMQDVVERTLAKSLALADHVNRDYDAPVVGRTINVRLPQRYRPK